MTNRTIISRGLAAAVALTFVQLAATAAQATDYNVGPIQITAPWARATPKGASSGAAYMTITNTGKTPDKVSCVSSDASAACQIHTMTMDNGVMQMRPVEGGLEIKPGETVTLKPGGLHVMLVNLKHPLEQGSTIKATLKFDAPARWTSTIRSPPSAPPRPAFPPAAAACRCKAAACR